MSHTTNEPFISIIIPVYNTALYLHQCLDSILAQTLHDIEIICINDGSSDESPHILDEYAKQDSRVHVIHQKNQGASAARNAGLALARAPYIGFVDADDWVEKETFKTALQHMLANNNVDLVSWGASIWVERDGALHRKKNFLPCGRHSFLRFFSGKHVLTNEIKRDIINVVWNKLYKTEVIRKYGIVFSTSLNQFEDFVFNATYFAWAKTGYFINRCYYHSRSDRNGSIMTTFSRGAKPHVYTTVMQAFEEIYNYYANWRQVENNLSSLAEMLAVLLGSGLWFSAGKTDFMQKARVFAAQYSLPDTKRHTFRDLKDDRAFARFFPLSFIDNIFSITNIGNKKVFRLFGIDKAFDRRHFKRKNAG
ncbi:MAG: glycosyltransferase [Betaproteobacteria bacterium]|nr:glycosyltransferase [Betaproteobacteria bacterium]